VEFSEPDASLNSFHADISKSSSMGAIAYYNDITLIGVLLGHHRPPPEWGS
jgi:hypothetical protein